VAGAAKGEVAPLMDVARGDQPQINRRKHLDQILAPGLRNVAYCGSFKLGIFGRVQIKRLVQEQRHRLAVGFR
jgi:hypothetical protein